MLLNATAFGATSLIPVAAVGILACGQVDMARIMAHGEKQPGLGWATVRVDSLNLGDHCGEHHVWAYSHETFVTEAALPPPDPGQTWTERGRERICRVCLRHEWQAEKLVQPQPVLSEFDSLKARLAP